MKTRPHPLSLLAVGISLISFGIHYWDADIPSPAIEFITPAEAQQPQERQFTITLTEREMLYIGSLLDEQKVKEAGPLMNKIQGQLSQQMQRSAAEQQNAVEKAIRDRIAADAAKAAEDKAKAEKKDP